MFLFYFLLVFGLSGAVAGGWFGLDIRGSAAAFEAYNTRNAELRAHAAGRLDVPPNIATATFARVLGAIVGMAGAVLALVSLILILDGTA
ncbi:hypothetical protein [Streptomyces sp. NPDC058612]|uniref:hypothetical protein n=1 Tax=Streptomyces sp. NPDC058612 TaxID=3346555 RepID=UPI00365D5ADE